MSELLTTNTILKRHLLELLIFQKNTMVNHIFRSIKYMKYEVIQQNIILFNFKIIN